MNITFHFFYPFLKIKKRAAEIISTFLVLDINSLQKFFKNNEKRGAPVTEKPQSTPRKVDYLSSNPPIRVANNKNPPVKPGDFYCVILTKQMQIILRSNYIFQEYISLTRKGNARRHPEALSGQFQDECLYRTFFFCLTERIRLRPQM